MSGLRITLQGPPGCETIPIGVELLDEEMNQHWSGSISIGRSHQIANLPNGRYAVVANLPSGKRAKQIVEIESDKEADVTIEVVRTSDALQGATHALEAASAAKLQWAQLSKPSAFQRRELQPGQLRSIWLRLWARRPNGVWTVLPWPTQRATRDIDLAVVQYDLLLTERSAYSEYYLQLGGPTLRWRLIALPPENVRVFVKGHQMPNKRTKIPLDPVEISVTTHDQHADVLLRYMRRGEIEEAREVSEPIIAQNLALRATASPLTTIVVGYFLLRMRDMKRLREWLEQPAPSVRGTSDASVIAAWYHLRAKEPRPDQARELLLSAVARGIPVYTRGVRLLLDGLEILDQPDQTPDRDVRAEVHSAWRRVGRYAAALEWQEPTTTFFAVDPDTPTTNSKEIRTGLPDDPAEVIFLADATPEDLQWRGLLAAEELSLREVAPVAGARGAILESPPLSGVAFDLPPRASAVPGAEDALSIALGEAEAQPVSTGEFPTVPNTT